MEKMKSGAVDFHRVEPQHLLIHDMLLNWACWVSARPQSYINPMFRQYRSNSWQWHTPERLETCDIIQAQELEKLMRHLPMLQREAIRWSYVVRCSPTHARRALACTYPDLGQYVRDGRQMLCNLWSRHQQEEATWAS